MGDPYLTIILVNDPEKDPKLLGYCFQAIRLLNADAIPDTQFIVLNQDPNGTAAYELAKSQPFDVEWFDAGYECVGGVVLWDLMASLKALWPRVRGRYHLIMHKEWLSGPGVLRQNIDWLKANGEPPLAMANLRRVGTIKQLKKNRMASSGKQPSIRMRAAMDTGDVDVIQKALARVSTLAWKHWLDESQRKPGMWVEDAYYGRCDWFNDMKFFGHADRQLFQDVYDLLAILFKQLHASKVAPHVPQVPLEAGQFYHLWHTKGYLHFNDRVIDYFCGDPERWEGTQFAERNTMERLRDFVAEGGAAHRNPLIAFRQGARGTAKRFSEGLQRWLCNRGKAVEQAHAPVTTPKREISRIVIVCRNDRWRNGKEPYQHVMVGLKAIGHDPAIVNRLPPQRSWPPWSGGTPDAIFVWNAQNGGWEAKVPTLRQEGMTVIAMERGFFDRHNYTQLDHLGFGHRASWAKGLAAAAPAGAAKRFKDAWGGPPVDMAARSDGYILVLLQVPSDSQLADSEINSPGPLVESVMAGVRKAELDVPVCVRAHPQFPWNCGTALGARRLQGTLEEAVAGARFCITINSNSANEALAWGCPVLAYGPALYLEAKVALRTSIAASRGSIVKMMDGWAPTASETRNYLYHLACRQWSTKELANGEVLQRILAAAVV